MNAPLPDWWVDATPDGKRAKHAGKHEVYVYGQQRADGMACIGCSWQHSTVMSTPAAIARHDADQHLEHDKGLWVPIDRGPLAGTCPCGKPGLYADSVLRTKVRAVLQQAQPWSPTPDQLADLLVGALVPDHGILVAFTAEQQTESDWELGYSASYTDLAAPEVLGHRLSERELAELYFQIEAMGGLGESEAYRDLDKAVERLGEEPARQLRERVAQPGLFDLEPDV